MLLTGTKTSAPDLNSQVKNLVASGWQVVSDGPTGVQLLAPRKMKTLDQLCLIVAAVVSFFSFKAGGFLIAVVLVDYFAFTKRDTQFISR